MFIDDSKPFAGQFPATETMIFFEVGAQEINLPSR